MHPIKDPSNALTFILAGNARVTFRSTKTEARFSYKVKANEEGSVHFVKVLTGADNTSDYRYIGFIREGKFFHGGGKSFASKDAPCVVAFGWAFKHLQAGNCPETLEVWHEGRCGRCGRALTVPESIETGLGPICAEA